MGSNSPSLSPSGGLGTVNKPSPLANNNLALPPASPATITSPTLPKNELDPPNILDHLTLQKYSAPATSPTLKVGEAPGPNTNSTSPPRGRRPAMSMVIGGAFATTVESSPTRPAGGKNHERRRSWGGEGVAEDWQRTKDVEVPAALPAPASTPVAEQEVFTNQRVLNGKNMTGQVVDSPVDTKSSNHKSQTSTLLPRAADKSGLLTPEENDLPTPPYSAYSSPPGGQQHESLSVPESPNSSTATTSPGTETGSPNASYLSLPDLSEVVIDGNERDKAIEAQAARGEQEAAPKEGIHSPGYQEFVSANV